MWRNTLNSVKHYILDLAARAIPDRELNTTTDVDWYSKYHSFFPAASGDATVSNSHNAIQTDILLDVTTLGLVTKQGNNHLDAMPVFSPCFSAESLSQIFLAQEMLIK